MRFTGLFTAILTILLIMTDVMADDGPGFVGDFPAFTTYARRGCKDQLYDFKHNVPNAWCIELYGVSLSPAEDIYIFDAS